MESISSANIPTFEIARPVSRFRDLKKYLPGLKRNFEIRHYSGVRQKEIRVGGADSGNRNGQNQSGVAGDEIGGSE
jgi:hypothetical protein